MSSDPLPGASRIWRFTVEHRFSHEYDVQIPACFDAGQARKLFELYLYNSSRFLEEEVCADVSAGALAALDASSEIVSVPRELDDEIVNLILAEPPWHDHFFSWNDTDWITDGASVVRADSGRWPAVPVDDYRIGKDLKSFQENWPEVLASWGEPVAVLERVPPGPFTYGELPFVDLLESETGRRFRLEQQYLPLIAGPGTLRAALKTRSCMLYVFDASERLVALKSLREVTEQ